MQVHWISILYGVVLHGDARNWSAISCQQSGGCILAFVKIQLVHSIDTNSSCCCCVFQQLFLGGFFLRQTSSTFRTACRNSISHYEKSTTSLTGRPSYASFRLETHFWVVATQTFFIFTPKIGEDEPNLTNIFQRGWNHQPDLCFLVILHWHVANPERKSTPFFRW